MTTKRPFTIDDVYRLRAVSDPQISRDGSRVAFVVTVADRVRDRNSSSIWLVDLESDPVQMTHGHVDSRPRWSPDGESLAFLRALEGEEFQVWVLPIDGGEATPVTSVELGVAEFEWSPNGESIAYTALCDLDHPPAEGDLAKAPPPILVKGLRYKAEGFGLEGSRRRHLFVAPISGGEPRRLTFGDFNASFPCWSPDGSRIAYVASIHTSADLDWVTNLFAIDLFGGEPKQVTDWGGSAAAPAWSQDGLSLVFIGSDQPLDAGPTRLFEVDADGGIPRDLCRGFDRTVILLFPGYPGTTPRFAPDGSTVFFCARDRGCVHVYATEGTGAPRKLVGGDDRLASSVTVGGEKIAFLHSDPRIPSDVYVANLDGSDERRLTRVNDEVLGEIDVYEPQPRNFTVPDGTEVHGWVIKGRAEDPAPMLLDIHGGPHNAWAPNFGSNGRLYHQILAGAGWNILLVNSRGSDGYGEGFYRALERGWGERDMQDFTAAVDTLVDEGIADPLRLAVTGNSYGGYMTNWIVSHTDRFSAAVTAGCVTNLQSMYGTSDLGLFLLGEMKGHAFEERQLYAQLSPITYVENVSTPVLIVHGLADHRAPVAQAEEWFASLRASGKKVEMVLYPEEGHLFIATGRPSHRVDFYRRLTDWVTVHTGTTRTVGG